MKKAGGKKSGRVKKLAHKVERSDTIEVLRETKHPKGGVVITFEHQGANKGLIFDALRLDSFQWYTWPECVKIDFYPPLSDAYESWQVRNKYNPPVEITPPQPKGNPRRCMFCTEDMSGLAAHCLACGGAMHLMCVREAGDRCLTPGCSPKE